MSGRVCPKCGAEVADGNRFCSECGTDVSAIAEPGAEANTAAAEETREAIDVDAEDIITAEEYGEDEEKALSIGKEKLKKKGSLKKKAILIAIIAGVVIVAAAVLYLIFGVFGKANGIDLTSPQMMMYSETESGRIVLPTLDKREVAVIPDGYAEAYLTPDKRNTVAVSGEGHMAILSDSGKEKTALADGVAYILYVSNDCAIYEKADSSSLWYRSFKNKAEIEITDDCEDINISSNAGVLVYAVDGNLMKVSASAGAPEYMATYDGEIAILTISDDGKLVTWEELDSGEIYACEDGNVTKLGSVEGAMTTDTNTNGTYTVIFGSGNRVLVKEYGEDARLIKLPDEAAADCVYTAAGPLRLDTDKNIKGIYFTADYNSDTYSSDLYYLADGADEAVLVIDNISDFEISNGKLYYTKEGDDTLYVSKLSKAKARRGKRISDGVMQFATVPGTDTVYYCTYEGSTATLFEYRGKGSQKVVTDVLWATLESDASGESIYYLGDLETVSFGTNEFYTGSLYRYEGEAGRSLVAEDVVMYTLSTGTSSGYIKDNKFIFNQYVKSTDNVITNLCEYDGGEVKILAEDALM